MKHYVGTKQILAKPMTRQEYNDYRGWTLPDDEDGNDTGFLVEYIDGGAANHPDHKCYISWSPKDVFDKAYKQHDDDFIGRMELEYDQLNERTDKLRAFINSDGFCALSEVQQDLLRAQHLSMNDYRGLLNQRIVLEMEDRQGG